MRLNVKTPITTHEGAPAKRIDYAMQLERSVMCCLLWENQFYESGEDIGSRIAALVPQCDPMFVARLAIRARLEMHLRHVPLLLAAVMTKLPLHKGLVGRLLPEIIQRADEITEFLAIYHSDLIGSRTLSAQVKKGLSAAFQKFNEYELAKYNRDGPWKLRDALFLCHAKPTMLHADRYTKAERRLAALPENREYRPVLTPAEDLYRRLVTGELKTPDTWEVALSGMHSTAPDVRAAEWRRLLGDRKLGALAFLRNLRNMLGVGVAMPDLERYAAALDVQRVLPFRFIAAARAAPIAEQFLEPLMLQSLAAHSKLPGTTVLMVDVSASMDGPLSSRSDITRLDAACGLAIMLREVCDLCVVATFSDQLRAVPPRRGFALRDAIVHSQPHHGTYLGKALRAVHDDPLGGYNRIIVITDEQSADSVPAPRGLGYMINVASAKNGVGYGAWHHIDGWSDAAVGYITRWEDANRDDAKVAEFTEGGQDA